MNTVIERKVALQIEFCATCAIQEQISNKRCNLQNDFRVLNISENSLQGILFLDSLACVPATTSNVVSYV